MGIHKTPGTCCSPLSPLVSESLAYRGVLLSTLLQGILNTSHHLLNVLLQIPNKLGFKKKKKKKKRYSHYAFLLSNSRKECTKTKNSVPSSEPLGATRQ
jgi:hypothetical protein